MEVSNFYKFCFCFHFETSDSVRNLYHPSHDAKKAKRTAIKINILKIAGAIPGIGLLVGVPRLIVALIATHSKFSDHRAAHISRALGEISVWVLSSLFWIS